MNDAHHSREQHAPHWLCVAGVWLVAAAWFAWRRTPYDDEWFSIEMALQADHDHFWRALQSDLHPPWPACLDRCLAWIRHDRYLLHGVRLFAAVAAFGITAPWLATRACLPKHIVWLAAFHPIVFMYAGSVRWYPFLLLAHAFRARALWGYDKPRQRHAGFIVGSAIGSLSGYIDPWFLLHDSAWWMWTARIGRGSLQEKHAWITVGISAATAAGLRWLSPLGVSHRMDWHGDGLRAQALLTWAGLGSIGEAGPPWPWFLFGAVIPFAIGRALWVGLRDPSSRTWCAYLVSSLFAWALASPFRVWHPRYSLWMWFALSAWTFVLLRRTLPERILLTLAACWCCVVLGFMWSGHGFFKVDLNELTAADCAALRRAQSADLVVISYPRFAELIEKQCSLSPRALRIPAIRIMRDEREQMRDLRVALTAHPRVVWSLWINAKSSLNRTDRRVRAVLSETCEAVARRELGEVPHWRVKMLFEHASASRIVQEVWHCR